uniref:Uncharacterized protein n=1 Tax=Aegilops tauschii subsp. strangulata TaxID=200361 RepID=A0A453KGD2_AEGTS
MWIPCINLPMKCLLRFKCPMKVVFHCSLILYVMLTPFNLKENQVMQKALRLDALIEEKQFSITV